MPIYDYRCTACAHMVEVVHGINERGPEQCERCGGSMRKALTAPAIHFKGSGWAKKDARSAATTAAKPDAGKSDAEPSSSSSGGDKGGSDSGGEGPSASSGGKTGDSKASDAKAGESSSSSTSTTASTRGSGSDSD